MTDSPTSERRGHWKAWLLLSGSLLAVPIIFFLASVRSQPHWDWSTSLPGQCAWPLLAVAFFICIASPFFSPLRLGWRFVVAAFGGVAFAGLLVASYMLCIALFGGSFH